MAPIGILTITLVVLFGALTVRGIVRREPDAFIGKVIVLGLLAKVAGTAGRYFLIADLYGGSGDFRRYLANGRDIAAVIRSGTLPDQARETGTPFMDFVAGVLFTVAPANLFVGFAVFGLLSFIGQYLFLKAFRLTVPDGDHRRYALLIMFVPTMLFWPSSLGKEAWLVFTLGIASYGAARVLRRARLGYLLALLGGAGVFAVRPHMGALFALSFVGAFLLRFRDPDGTNHAVGWLVGLALIGVAAGYAATNFGDLLPQDESVVGSQTDQIFAETARRTTQGGSEFDSRPVRNPIDFLHAAVTVPFRPFPNEGHNVQAQLSGLEGVILLGIFIASFGRLRRLPRYLLTRPYVAFATAYSIGFIIAFSNVGNFGIITRQRAQLLPLLFVLMALPAVEERAKRRSVVPVLTLTTAEEQAPVADAVADAPPTPAPSPADSPDVDAPRGADETLPARGATQLNLLSALDTSTGSASDPSSRRDT
jgi:hypothetical protein